MKNNVEIVGKKIGMTQVFDNQDHLIPVTIIEAGPCPITQIKTLKKDGYSAIQFGFRIQKRHRLSKGILGHFKKSEVSPVANLFEFRTENIEEFNLGENLSVSDFNQSEKVDLIGITKGRGFQGVVKRWNFSGGRASHGSMSHRRGGSYGNCQWPGEIQKGKKMPGHMGSSRCTVQNLLIIKIIKEKNLILIKGSIPGHIGGLIRIRKAIKHKNLISKISRK